MKILALDIGAKSCGIAQSDNLKITAQGKENYFFQFQDWNNLITHLENDYFLSTEKIIIGLPLFPSGDDSQTTLMVRDFRNELEKRTDIPIEYQEEFGSTKKANKIMISADISRKKRKKHVDKLAAVIILQDYMNRSNDGSK